MPVCNIKTWHLCKFFSNSLYIFIIRDYPKLVTETINRSNEVVFWSSSSIARCNFFQHRIIWISKENRFYICIVYTNMLHTIFFLISTCKFMFLYNTIYIILTSSTNNNTILCLAIHCLSINVVLFFIVLHQPTLVLEHLKILSSLFVNTWIVFTCTFWEIYFWFNDMIKTLFVSFSFFTCFL